MPHEALNPHRIAAALASQRIGHEIRWVKETGSTSDDVAALAAAGHPEGVVVFAESQSRGRGRRGNQWVAPPSANLLFSLLLRPEDPPILWRRLTHLCALALCEAVDELTGLRCAIKWPNDVLVGSRKIAGILVESAAGPGSTPGHGDEPRGFVVAGIGLNVNMTAADLPRDLRDAASSLHIETGRHLDRTRTAIAVLRALNRHYPASLPDPRFARSLEQVRARSSLLGRPVTALVAGGREARGTVVDLGPDGELVLRGDDGSLVHLASADLVRPDETAPAA